MFDDDHHPARVGRDLIAAHNSLSGELTSLQHVATTTLATYAGGARGSLSRIAAAHASLTGEAPNDPEYTAALAVVAAAEAFLSAVASTQDVLHSPTNWRRGHPIDAALAALNL